MPLPDYYRVLGVNHTAKPHEIKAAYRRLAIRYHPDLHPNDPRAEEILKSINQAYGVLRDAQHRQDYDMQVVPAITRTSSTPVHPTASAACSSTARRSSVRDPHARLKMYLKTAFLLWIIGLFAVLAYTVLLQ